MNPTRDLPRPQGAGVFGGEMDALTISHLHKVYRGGVVGADDISFRVARGDFFGFLGPNGAGKSTTIHCITGIATITSGTVEVFGIDVVKRYREARRLVGLSAQEFNVYTFATCADILDWAAAYFGMPKKQRRERIAMLMERFGLTEHANKEFRQLSGGLKRRLVLARAIVHDPELLILDEPTAGVDVELRHELWTFLEEMNAQGKTILLTSHYLEEVEHLCRNIAIVANGKVARIGAKEEYLRDGGLEPAYLAAAGKKPVAMKSHSDE
jgi:ABC-2 type transport system ATP-binding protein